MRVLISAVGTRGDVQPALGLAVQVREQGRQVRLCVPPNFVDEAQGLGFEARPIGVAMRAPRPGERPQPVPDLIADQFETIAQAAAGCDLIAGAGVHQYAVRSVAEARGLPHVVAAYAPVALPSSDLPPPGSATARPGSPELAALWAEERDRWNGRALERVNDNRRRLDLAPIADVLDHILGDRPWLACDPVLGPAPETPGRSVETSGAWLLPDPSPLPPEVEGFLGAGPPPVYLGLGSMPAPPELSGVLIAAVRALGRRAILAGGWASLAAIDAGVDVLAVDEVNHQALFRQVAAVVHHGGAGTTTAAALAGAPQVATPMFSDQFHWGRRIEALGLGAAVPAAGLSAEALAQALEVALGSGPAARGLAARIAPDGAAIAARRLSDLLESASSR